MLTSLMFLFAVALAAEVACEMDGTCAGPGDGGLAKKIDEPESRETQHRWVDYRAAVDKAVEWIERLEVDPVALQRRGVKGKKKLGEAMAAYTVALRYEDDPEKVERLRRRFAVLAAKASGPDYHNLLSCDDKEFKQNSMSYLRVLRLMQMEGIDTSSYMEELIRIKARLDGHLVGRGPWQRAMFARYYDDFGLAKPSLLLSASYRDPLAVGAAVVSKRMAADQYDKSRAYEMTHEVFVAFDYGFSSGQSTFSEEDFAYLSKILPDLIDRQISSQNGDAADLLAEFLTCMAFLGFCDHPAARRGIDHLLDGQNGDGTWGDYEAMRARVGDVVDQLLYLHTTYVALQALHESYRRSSCVYGDTMLGVVID